jgi:hypothetical protein
MHHRVLVIANNEASDEAAMTDAVRRRSGCYLDDLYRACQDLTCNQIVLGEARVSRRDQVQQTLKGGDMTAWRSQVSQGDRSQSVSLFMGQRRLDREAHAITQSFT